MNRIQMKGGTLIKLDDDLVEVIVDENVEVTAAMVDACDQVMASQFKCPCQVLINRKHSYHYTFEAQQRLAALRTVHSVAILSHTAVGDITAKIVSMLPGNKRWKVSFFSSRHSALQWLDARREQVAGKRVDKQSV